MKLNRNNTPLLLVVLALFATLTSQLSIFAQGTSFTYQGRLNDGTNPANGRYDMQFYLRDDPTAGNPVGNTNTFSAATPVVASNGVFTVALDFGSTAFLLGAPRWLAIGVRTNGSASAYTTLTPRQSITSAPYAITSQNLSGTLAAAQLAGAIPAAALNGVNGSGLTSLNASQLTGGTVADPRLSANVALLNASQAFSGANNFLGNVGIGSSSPLGRLELQAGADTDGANDPKGFALAYRLGGFRHWIRSRHNSGAGGNGIDFFLNTNTVAGASSAPGTGCVQVLTLANEGVGIGTASPGKKLQVGDTEVAGSEGMVRLVSRTTSGGATVRTWDIGVPQTGDDASGQGYSFVIRDTGGVDTNAQFIVRYDSHYVGIGTNTPQQALHVVGQYALIEGASHCQAYIGGSAASSVQVGSLNPSVTTLLLNNPSAGVKMDVNARSLTLDAGLFATGEASLCALTIRGGCDLAEPFQMSGPQLAKGSLVIIDEANPGKVKLSERAYDTRVAGIVSGANGVNPGITLHQEGVLDGGQNVALSGRVYALAEAANGPISPGDLLTSSSTPGRVMRVTDHARAQGAIIGKAMSALDRGEGVVLVLVSLQ